MTLKINNLPWRYAPNNIHLVVCWQRQAVRDAGWHDDDDDLSRNGDRQFLLEALIHVFDKVQEDDTGKAQDESDDVGSGDVCEYRLGALGYETEESVTTYDQLK